jgi:RimJ/RimL family protein N-acetyltransferase
MPAVLPPLALADLRAEDYDTIVSWFADEEQFVTAVARAFNYPLSRAEYEDYFLPEPGPRPARRCLRAVVDGQTVGMASLARLDWRNDSAHLAFVAVDPAWRGQGVGAAMLGQVLRLCFHDYNLHRVSLLVFPANLKAIRCYERLGFQREGVSRQACRFGSGYLDAIAMGLLRSEWASPP